MSEQLTLSVEEIRPALLPSVMAAVASLPRSFELVKGPAEVVVIDGLDGWGGHAAAAAAAGAKAAVVVDPRAGAADHGDFGQLDVPVVVDTLWRHSSVVERIADAFQEAETPGSLLEAAAVVDGVPLADALLALELTASDLLGRPRFAVEDVIETATSITLLGAVNESRFRLAVVSGVSLTTTAKFRIVSAAQTVEAQIHGPGSAAAATGAVTTASGRTELPTSYESTRRTALQRAWVAVQRRQPVDDLDLLAGATAR